MPALYALLVGIDDYHPRSGVSNLYGCVNDVRAVREFLLRYYPHLLLDPERQIRTLRNEEATRGAVIGQFTDHLGKARPGDLALFYYSGHGSHELTSEEFAAVDAMGQNETLVCYDSRLPDGLDLADKELALLLAGIPEGVQRIVILDSCHSGSATRNLEESTLGRRRQQPARFTGAGGWRRPLATYLSGPENPYMRQLAQTGQLEIPHSAHILISACDRQQTALETNARHGLFTTHLLRVLERTQGHISYNNLFVEVRDSVLEDRADQTPRVEPIGGFNGNLRFLGFDPVDTTRYPVRWSAAKQAWFLAQGAVHGLPIDPADLGELRLRLLPEGGDESQAVEAAITEVNMEDSLLYCPEADTGRAYQAEFLRLPPHLSTPVWLHGDAERCRAFHEQLAENPSPYLSFTDHERGAAYDVLATAGQYLVHHLPSGQLITGAEGPAEWAARVLVDRLNHIERWERVGRLEKRATRLDESQFDLRCRQTDRNRAVLHEFSTNQITLDLDRLDNGEWDTAGLQLTGQNRSEIPLHVLVLLLDRRFAIAAVKSATLPPQSSAEELFFEGLSILDPKLTEEVDTIKLFVSTTPLNPAFFTQDALELGLILRPERNVRGRVSGWGAAPIVDWFTRTLTVTLSGNLQAIGAQPARAEALAVEAHPHLQANLAFASIASHSRSVDPIQRLPELLRGSDLRIVDFSRERSLSDKSVIVLSDIQGDQTLAGEPLRIRLDLPAAGRESLLAVTFDGEFILPFGEVSHTDGQSLLTVHQLPAQSDPQRRSLGKALKFCVLKTALGKRADVFRLRRVDYTLTGGDRRTAEGVAEHVAAAGRVLLLIHGIIGDTREVADEAGFAVRDGGFDLVLTFDYENLSTPIPDIAARLRDELAAAGFGPADGKELHIVAHSMGGLVSRCFIENLGGEALVDKLVMFGTPNGGSRFGKLPDAVKTLRFLLGFALNFLPGHVKDVLEKIEDLAGDHAPDVLRTLDMMDRDSDFIRDLAKNPAPATAYYVVAGDISDYADHNPESTWFSRLMDKMTVLVGKLVYFDQPNDIAVGVEDIQAIPFLPDGHRKTVSCHHLNYFVNPNSVPVWRNWL